MSGLKAFMKPPVTDTTEDVIISDRFTDEDGKVQPFKIRIISQEINESLHNQASRPIKKNGVVIGSQTDSTKYGNLLIVACVVYPNFKDSELCDYYKTKDPLDVPRRMLTAGEFNKLVKAVNRINGFDVGDDQAETLEEEAKN
jgi:hypothetical protein